MLFTAPFQYFSFKISIESPFLIPKPLTAFSPFAYKKPLVHRTDRFQQMYAVLPLVLCACSSSDFGFQTACEIRSALSPPALIQILIHSFLVNAFFDRFLVGCCFLYKCIVIQFFRCIFYTIYRSRRFCSNCRCRIRYIRARAYP